MHCNRSLLKKDELSKLKEALEHDKGIMEHSYGRDDGEGGMVKVCLWNQPGDDITGIIARSEKMAGTFEQVIKNFHGAELIDGRPGHKLLFTRTTTSVNENEANHHNCL